MRDLIENFDKGNKVADVAGFELKRPRPTETLEGKLKKNRAWKERNRKALLNGTARCKRGAQGKGKYSKPAIVVDLEVRDGKGRVQFKNTTATV
jgi:hypothetical protein